MKFTDKQREKIIGALDDYTLKNEWSNEAQTYFIDRIESILTPPVQDGREIEAMQFVKRYYKERGLRSELAEAKREAERLKEQINLVKQNPVGNETE